jgi:hypothetical protein
LDSSFNTPNATYTVELAHEFFIDKKTGLAPLGLQSEYWKFITGNNNKKILKIFNHDLTRLYKMIYVYLLINLLLKRNQIA